MQTTMRLYVGGILCLLLIMACGGGGSVGDDGDEPPVPVTTTDYQVNFSPAQVVSGQTAPDSITTSASLSSARGADIIASGSVSVSGASATAVTINSGYAGEVGPVAVTLSNVGGGNWNIPTGTELDDADLFRLQAAGFYVSIQTPNGELRGQVLPPGWTLTMIDLTADEVVPASTSTGNAKGGFAINPMTGNYRTRITINGIGDVVSASIREAIAGGRGDVVISLEQSATDPNVWGTPDINNVNAEGQLTSSGLDKYGQGKFHLSVETMTYLNGEIRGQVIPEGVRVFAMDLSDAEVVVTSGPPVVSTGSATGRITYVPDRNEFAVAINTDLLATLSVFIHQAPFGQNGPGIFSLMQDAIVPGNWVLPATTLSTEQEDALNNQRLYVSVVTSDFIDGELRGQITLGNSVSVVAASVDENGGTLSLTDPAGASYSLVLESGAVVDETVSLTMQRAALPQNLPGGMRALSAVRLGPDGTSFANTPVITINDGDTGSGTARVGYMISDDGARIEFTPLLGDDFVVAAFPMAQHSFEVPHFTLVGVAEIDVTMAFPVPPDASPAEARAKQLLADHFTFIAQRQLEGAEIQIDPDLVATIMRAWFNNIGTRSSGLNNAGLPQFRKLIEETVRATEVSQKVGLESGESQVGGAFDNNVFGRVQAVLQALDTACLSGDTGSFDRMLKWFAALDRLYVGGLPNGIDPEPIDCLVTVAVEPQGPLAAIEGGEDIDVTATVMNPSGADVTFFTPLGFRWLSEKGINTSDGSTVSLDASEVGLREAVVKFNYFRADTSTAAVIVPNHLGTRGVFVTGSATCPDTEDDGARSFDGIVAISSHSVQSVSDTVAEISLQGSGSVAEVTISNISVNARYDTNTESQVNGSASGSLTFNLTEIDPETGEPIPVNGSLQMQGTAPRGVFSFPNTTGSDSFGCSLQGLVQIGEVI